MRTERRSSEPLKKNAEEEAFFRLYGDWAPLTPTEVARELQGFERPWWVVGGWAIEAATGYRRDDHERLVLAKDALNPSCLRRDPVDGMLRCSCAASRMRPSGLEHACWPTRIAILLAGAADGLRAL